MEPYIRITVTDKENKSTSYLFQKNIISVGKQANSDLQLNNPLVSRQHATIKLKQNKIEVEDQKSTNGTIVNGENIEIGPFRLTLQLIQNLTPIIAECYKKTISIPPGNDFESGVRKNADEAVKEICGSGDNGHKILPLLIEELLTLGPLDELLADQTITEIMVNGHSQIFIERNGSLYLHHRHFSCPESLKNCIDRILLPSGRRLDEASPMVDTRLPDGSRVNIIIPPISLKGPVITIRKFSKTAMTLEQLIEHKTVTEEQKIFLKELILSRKNIIISGGTGAGKTTMLNALAKNIPPGERIITIEDAAELQLNHPHIIRLESRPANVEERGEITIRQLVRNALRMRPDRIIVGECRGAESLDMLQAMNTGHPGSLTTLHANSPADALRRLETMVLMAEAGLPLRAIREQISSAIDYVIQLTKEGNRRIIQNIAEVCHMEGEIIAVRNIKTPLSLDTQL